MVTWNNAQQITGTDTLDDQKKSLLVGREKLDKSSRVLKSALSEAHDTVTVGITTLETMDEQTKRLGGINDKVKSFREIKQNRLAE